MAAYAGVSMSCGMSAVPNLRPILAASARREVGLVPGFALGLAASLAAAGDARAEAPVPSTAAAPPAAPIARRLRRLIADSYQPKYFGQIRNFRLAAIG
jgi:hypothetical protein